MLNSMYMTLEELRKETPKENEEEDDKEKKEANKSFDEALIETLSTLTEHVKALSDSQASLEERVEKALFEEPKTQLDLTPSGTADAEDVGADVVVPDTLQSNSVQAGLDDDKSGQDKPEGDKAGLAMQQKANFDFTTETPRPSASVENINKSADVELNMVLKDARSQGFEGLSQVARKILAGDYGSPDTTTNNGGYY